MTPSRQLAWKQRRIAAGLCGSCGVQPLASKNYCADCRDRDKVASRNRYRLKNGIPLDRRVMKN